MSMFKLMHQKMDEIISKTFAFQFLIPLILLIAITKCLSKSAKKKQNLPPSPRKLPILGNLHQLGSLPHRNLQSMAEKHGPIMLLHFGRVPTLIVSSAAAAGEIMKTHDLDFADRPESSLGRRLLYDNKDVSVAPYGEYWRQLKSICVVQLLSNRRVQSFRSVREEETEIMVKKIGENPGSVNLSQLITQLMNDLVCRSAIGRKYGEGDENGGKFLSILREFLELLGTTSVGDFVPSLWWINRINGFDRRVDPIAKEMDEFLEGMISARLENPAAANAGENFVDILLEIYRNKSAGVSINRDSIKATILDVFAAGTDTTSTVLEWAMTELLRNPEIMKKLQNEVREVTKGNHNITDKDIDKMHYLKAVMKETMRFHTPVPLLVPRVARNDVEVMGYHVSAGTMVMINAWAIGRDPVSWDEPDEFRPERFLNSSIDFKGLDFELIPFGAGRRGCPGTAFAMATNEFALANLIGKFDWELPHECRELDMRERPGVTIRRLVPLLAIGTYNKT